MPWGDGPGRPAVPEEEEEADEDPSGGAGAGIEPVVPWARAGGAAAAGGPEAEAARGGAGAVAAEPAAKGGGGVDVVVVPVPPLSRDVCIPIALTVGSENMFTITTQARMVLSIQYSVGS